VNVEASSVSLPFQFDPDDLAYIENPHPSYRYRREHAPAYYGSTGRAWIVSRYDDVVAILRRRDQTANIVFGTGWHHCIGAALAHLQGEAAVATLLERFPAMALAAQPRSCRTPFCAK
jgi:cytochrome P450